MAISKTNKKTSTKRRTKLKPITLIEFRAWLEGVEELQDTDWSPSNEQWNLIRKKIDYITDPEPIIETVFAPAPSSVPNVGLLVPPVAPPMPTRPAFVPPAPTSIPTSIPIAPEMTDAARQAMSGVPLTNLSNTVSAAPGITSGADGKIHTPNIDTSNGDYSSGFK